MRAGLAIALSVGAALLLARSARAGANEGDVSQSSDFVDSALDAAAGLFNENAGLMKTSAAGIAALQHREGFSPVPYPDASGYSIGYGHFIKPGESFTEITPEQGGELLAADLATSEDAVNRHVSVPLTQSQFDALVSLVYNIGETNFRKSTLLKMLNAGDYQGAAEQFARWNKSQGETVQALVDRRADEAAQFVS